jgi:hypothetical protein
MKSRFILQSEANHDQWAQKMVEYPRVRRPTAYPGNGDMSWNESEILAARRTILEAAQAMLAGTLSYIEGAREILFAWRNSKLSECDPDLLPFVGIVSDTDALPFGEMRAHWQASAQKALQPKIDQSEVWAKGFGEPFCRNLVKRLSDGGADHVFRWP